MLLFFTIIGYALRAYYYTLIIYVLMSWIPELRGTKFHQVVSRIAEPYMRIFRGLLVIGMFDLTPIIGFILFQIGLGYFDQMLFLMAQGA
jgi:YggT family protein